MIYENRIKILFVQKTSDGEFETEGLWCERKDNNFIVDNIPFISRNISLGDTISAEFDENDSQYYFDNLISYSGNTTVRVFLYDNEYINTVRDWLDSNNCESEVFLVRNIIAVNIPNEVIYTPIKDFFEKGEKEGRWVYEESCLEHEY